jgi:hypothetical protein
MQTWQTFLARAQLRQISTRFSLPLVPACQANTVKGVSQILHALPCGSLVMRM